MHGNEPGGAIAARRVIDRLSRPDAELRGEIIGLTGNLAALRAGRRYHVKDLNRQWGEANVDALVARGKEQDDAEDREQRELFAAISAAILRASRSSICTPRARPGSRS
jgi:succinylglutamate desuccinylase